MLLAYYQTLLVHQNSLVCTSVDFLTAQVVWVLGWIAIGEAFAVCHLVDNAITIHIDGFRSLSQQDRDISMVITTLSLFCR
jgi:hypothetical protein